MATITTEVSVSLSEFDDDDLMTEMQERGMTIPLEKFDTEELIDELSGRDGLFCDPLFLAEQCRLMRTAVLLGHDDKALDIAKELCKDVLGTAL